MSSFRILPHPCITHTHTHKHTTQKQHELAYTGRNFTSAEALTLGLLSRVLPTPTETWAAATKLAVEIASKSPVAVAGTKANLLYSRDHSVQDGLNYMTTWNMAALQSEDIGKAVQGAMMKEKPTFSKL